MERPSRPEDTAESRAILEGHLRESYGRVVYSHKTHEKCADILLTRLGRIKLAQIILSAIVTCGLITAVFTNLVVIVVVSAFVSSILLVLNLYTKEDDIGAIAQKHKQAANDIWLIRERYLSLITDLRMNTRPLEELVERRDLLVDELHAVYAGSPSTNANAYRKAQQALKVSEDMTFSDAEIDNMLPVDLRRS